MSEGKPQATFLVRFVGEGVSPESLPLRAVTEALSAVQDIANARDPFDKKPLPTEKAIRLLGVEGGSAVYSCVARSAEEARRNLGRLGAILAQDEPHDENADELVAALSSIQSLSAVAKATNCRIEIDLLNGTQEHAFAIAKDDYSRVSKNLLLKGDTTVIGTVERAGGATSMKCMLRVPGRRHALYCNVATKDLVRRLGHVLYESIAATGSAVWIHRSWRIYEFTIRDFTQPRLENGKQAIDDLRRAGLKAWDDIADPAAFIEEMRSDSGN